MTFPHYNLSDPIDVRKPILANILTALQDYYQLPTADLCTYVIPTALVPDDLQVDLLIHALNLYQKQVGPTFIAAIVQANMKVYNDYLDGNHKSLNVLIGKAMKEDKALNPKELAAAFQSYKP